MECAPATQQSYLHRLAPELVRAILCGVEGLASEKARIMRALYMAETFFNLFRTTSSNIPEAAQRRCMNEFLVHLAPLEVEQLACVHDFLFRKVSPVFNDVAAHDVLWREFQVEPALWLGSPELQFFLFKGLGAIKGIAAAKTYAEQQKFFSGIPGTRRLNLHRALKEFSYKESTTEGDSIPIFATSEDYDQGPFVMWK
ncbi:unnamed protein product [Clonostachys chloroleuca]|uniref:Uncharacterized protein n=1 Tax=Clonostachys chloroleuca TaxID=1926264 RepID=A0AA35PZX4_9HYPO|nr:unnamed protein product [Clonostachys chloroleuca]